MTRAPIQGPAVTLVIGSGSVKCAAAIGVVKALSDVGIGIERVVGCSGGALFAAGVAMGFDAATMADITVRTWTRRVTSKRNHMGFLRLLAPRLFGFKAESFGLRDDAPMLAAFRAVFGEQRIEDTPIPLHITATDFQNGELVEITRGDLVEAIRASASLPLAFAPVKLGDRLLIDGYMADPLPVSVAMKSGSRVIVAVGFESPYQSNIRSAGRFAAQLSAILANNLLRSRLAFQSDRFPKAWSRFAVHQVLRFRPGLAVEEYLTRGVPHKLVGLSIDAICEQAPDRDNRIQLSPKQDRFGMPLPVARWRIGELEIRTLTRLADILQREFGKAGLPLPVIADWIADRDARGADIIDMGHSAGTTRMASDPGRGVVDADGKVHGVEGLYIAGASIFPTCGHANPTLMIMAFAYRLADHLTQRRSP